MRRVFPIPVFLQSRPFSINSLYDRMLGDTPFLVHHSSLSLCIFCPNRVIHSTSTLYLVKSPALRRISDTKTTRHYLAYKPVRYCGQILSTQLSKQYLWKPWLCGLTYHGEEGVVHTGFTYLRIGKMWRQDQLDDIFQFLIRVRWSFRNSP